MLVSYMNTKNCTLMSSHEKRLIGFEEAIYLEKEHSSLDKSVGGQSDVAEVQEIYGRGLLERESVLSLNPVMFDIEDGIVQNLASSSLETGHYEIDPRGKGK